jgi:hypothetical protein
VQALHQPEQTKQPCVFEINQLLSRYASQGALSYYLDLHAYGNALSGAQHVEALLFSKLAALNNAHFDFGACNFTEGNMCARDKDGTSKDGAGRVALFRRTGLTHLYTIEANYNGTCFVPEMAPMARSARSRCRSPEPPGRASALFSVDDFHQVCYSMRYQRVACQR